MSSNLEHHYKVKGVKQSDGTVKWTVEIDDGLDDGNVWDEAAHEWRFPVTEAEETDAGDVTRDLFGRLA